VEDAVFVVGLALAFAAPSFLVGAGAVSLLCRLVRGRFLGLLNAPTAIAFGVYLLIWICLVSMVAANVAITH
jgi:hypothetical protein